MKTVLNADALLYCYQITNPLIAYVCDGLSHLADFTVNGLGVGEKGKSGRASVLNVKANTSLELTAQVAALLDEKPNEGIRQRPQGHPVSCGTYDTIGTCNPLRSPQSV